MQLKRIVEALLFVAGKPMTSSEIAQAIRKNAPALAKADEPELAQPNKGSVQNPDTQESPLPQELLDATEQSDAPPPRPVNYKKVQPEEIELALEELRQDYEGFSFTILKVSGGFRLATRPELAEWILPPPPENKPSKLSPSAMETLSIIAYRQPISRAEIEAVRGVGVGGVLESLLERGVIRVAGRADVPGRPLLYETTNMFLDHFGLADLSQLPNVEELRRVKLPEAIPTAEQQQELISESQGSASEN